MPATQKVLPRALRGGPSPTLHSRAFSPSGLRSFCPALCFLFPLAWGTPTSSAHLSLRYQQIKEEPPDFLPTPHPRVGLETPPAMTPTFRCVTYQSEGLLSLPIKSELRERLEESYLAYWCILNTCKALTNMC